MDCGDLFGKMESVSVFDNADTVLLYASIPGEISSWDAIEKWSGFKRIVLPVVVGDCLELREYCRDLLVPGYRGILEPSAESRLVKPSEIGFAVIPGVAFDRFGHRLGRGKGYYDRLLPSLPCVKAGVCYDHQIVDTVPVEAHDISMDMVFSPNYSYICNLEKNC